MAPEEEHPAAVPAEVMEDLTADRHVTGPLAAEDMAALHRRGLDPVRGRDMAAEAVIAMDPAAAAAAAIVMDPEEEAKHHGTSLVFRTVNRERH